MSFCGKQAESLSLTLWVRVHEGGVVLREKPLSLWVQRAAITCVGSLWVWLMWAFGRGCRLSVVQNSWQLFTVVGSVSKKRDGSQLL